MSNTQLSTARLTHVALPSGNIDAAIEFYTSLTPLVVVERFSDADGESVWLSNPGQVETPFVLVLVSFNKDKGNKLGLLFPFAHIGIELPNREDVDAMAERGREAGCLHWEARQMPPPVGYICALTDPDGNVVEFSHDQNVFSSVRAKWGADAE
jgi:lactoylglutathione lyase